MQKFVYFSLFSKWLIIPKFVLKATLVCKEKNKKQKKLLFAFCFFLHLFFLVLIFVSFKNFYVYYSTVHFVVIIIIFINHRLSHSKLIEIKFLFILRYLLTLKHFFSQDEVAKFSSLKKKMFLFISLYFLFIYMKLISLENKRTLPTFIKPIHFYSA